MKHIFVNFVHFNTMVTPSAVIVHFAMDDRGQVWQATSGGDWQLKVKAESQNDENGDRVHFSAKPLGNEACVMIGNDPNLGALEVMDVG
ncbi:BcepGomrgp63 [Burkholderia phage BcepGomr]|uniref:BcepGomrgp63 n=1 Tax=Burkholderia phage BcepGomr TaxID=437329 RepID=UPI000150354B|nr:BcepGomrgp63 [Burkholderia phage BcepGomr]ABP63634.1 BcepGomrgp63 [Burkholderia phage BcepGomr]